MTYQPGSSPPMLETAFELLPAELLSAVVGLSALNACLPAVCRVLSPANAFRPGEQPHRTWLHRAIFIDPAIDPLEPDTLNCRYPLVWQRESHVAYFFKALAPLDPGGNPAVAAGMAPDSPLAGQSLITKEFVEWIFGRAGPFGAVPVPKDHDVASELRAIRGRDKPVGAATAHDGVLKYPRPPNYPLPSWRLVPDAFLLISLLIRTSQFDSLEFALEQLLALFPSLRAGTCAAPFTTWSHYMLDNRSRLRFDLFLIVGGGNGDPIMTYPTFLCMLALWDWSLPAIAIIERVFTSTHVNLTDIACQVTSNSNIFRGMVSALSHIDPNAPSKSTRILGVLDWLASHGAIVDLERFPFMSTYVRRNYSTFADVFVKYDVPNLRRTCAAPRHPYLWELLEAVIVDWATKGQTDVLKVALDNGMSDGAKKKLLIQAAKNRGEKWATEVVECLARNESSGRLWRLTAKVLRALQK